MLYSVDEIIRQIDKGQTFEYLFFYGYRPSDDGSNTASCCSQWFPSEFQIDGIKYSTAEHFMMAEKSRFFADEGMLQAILSCETPKAA